MLQAVNLPLIAESSSTCSARRREEPADRSGQSHLNPTSRSFPAGAVGYEPLFKKRTKTQAPRNKQEPILKCQTPKRSPTVATSPFVRLLFGIWPLFVPWCLGFGTFGHEVSGVRPVLDAIAPWASHSGPDVHRRSRKGAMSPSGSGFPGDFARGSFGAYRLESEICLSSDACDLPAGRRVWFLLARRVGLDLGRGREGFYLDNLGREKCCGEARSWRVFARSMRGSCADLVVEWSRGARDGVRNVP